MFNAEAVAMQKLCDLQILIYDEETFLLNEVLLEFISVILFIHSSLDIIRFKKEMILKIQYVSGESSFI